MTGQSKLAGFLIIVILMTSLTPTRGEWAAQAQGHPSALHDGSARVLTDGEQAVQAKEPPQPLPHDCDGVTPPGEDPPACCAYGYVYYDGVPVTGASVHIESSYGALDTTTASGGASNEPYYSIDLSSAPLLVSSGDIITVTAIYEGGSASTVYEVAPDGQQVDVPIVINPVPLFGDGSDGDLVVSGMYYVDDVRTALSSNVNAGQETINVASTSGFSGGDEVLVIQMQGTGAGVYEFGIIASVGAGALALQQSLQNNYFVGGSSKAQVLRVPNYQNVTVQNGGVLTAHAWDGSTGGIVAFRANGIVTVETGGMIDMNGQGFRGAPTNNDQAGYQGESELGLGGQPSAANGMGGGGGCSLGYGNAAGGGGGGHGSSGQPGQPGNNNGCDTPGSGGEATGMPNLLLMYLGGGGGSGGAKTNEGPLNYGGAGGNGGGAVLIFANGISVTGSVIVNGSNGATGYEFNRGANGGGGAGGSILVRARTADIGISLLTAIGGSGGRYESGGSTQDGGDGGVGRIRIEYSDVLSGTTNPSASTQQREFHTGPIVTIHTVYPHPAVRGQDVVTFRGSAVDNDEDGASITQYVWRSDLDGLLSTQATFTRAASSLSAGTHTIYFKARDDEGEWSDEVSTTLTVNQPQGSPPTASFTVSPTSGDTSTVFTFDASGCSDAEDPVAALDVRWDWEDDGIYDTGWSTTKTITHTYTTTGTYTIRLQVRDTDSLTDTTTRSVTVNPPAGETAWAFLLYLDGDNNLNSWLQRALDNLEAATANQDVTVLALLDGYGGGNTWRYHVQPGGNYTDGVNRWYMGELDMSNPQTLSDFVTWARDNYPAEHYYLAVADHGRGTTGIAWDDTSGSGQFITVAELRTALRDVTGDGTEPLDVVHYDACLMGMVENAYQIKDYAHYFIATENLGWSIFAYDRYAAQVTAGTTPEQLAATVVDEYYNALAGYPRTIAALDLGQAGAVEGAVSALASALQASLDANKYYVRNTRDATQKFDSRDYFVIDINDEYLDLYDFARLIKQNVPDSSVQNAAQGVMDAVNAFVVAERHESGYYEDHPYWDLDDAHGVSIYFPPASSGWGYNDYMAHIFRFTADGQWDEFLQAYYGLMGLPPETPADPGVPPVLNRPYSVYLPIVIK